jgi:ABC-type multidrug transport system permease subunit
MLDFRPTVRYCINRFIEALSALTIGAGVMLIVAFFLMVIGFQEWAIRVSRISVAIFITFFGISAITINLFGGG